MAFGYVPGTSRATTGEGYGISRKKTVEAAQEHREELAALNQFIAYSTQALTSYFDDKQTVELLEVQKDTAGEQYEGVDVFSYDQSFLKGTTAAPSDEFTSYIQDPANKAKFLQDVQPGGPMYDKYKSWVDKGYMDPLSTEGYNIEEGKVTSVDLQETPEKQDMVNLIHDTMLAKSGQFGEQSIISQEMGNMTGNLTSVQDIADTMTQKDYTALDDIGGVRFIKEKLAMGYSYNPNTLEWEMR